jgi:glutaminyl-peptide cyclotransferase
LRTPLSCRRGLSALCCSFRHGDTQIGHSQLRELDLVTGVSRRAVPLPPGYFGEGATVVGDRIWQLTYRNDVAIEWDKAT